MFPTEDVVPWNGCSRFWVLPVTFCTEIYFKYKKFVLIDTSETAYTGCIHSKTGLYLIVTKYFKIEDAYQNVL